MSKRHPPTTEQTAIVTAARTLNDVLVIQAGAGAGKTSTLVMVAESLPGRGQYTSFVRALVDDAKTKFPSSCAVQGIHQLAFRAVGCKYKHRLNSGRIKSEEVARRLGIEAVEVGGKRLAAGFLAGQVMAAVWRFCQSDAAEVSEQHFAYIDGIDQPDGERRTWENNNWLRGKLLPFAVRAWADLASENGSLPFSHDCYVKIWELNDPVISCDYLLADETQDLSGVMLSIFRKQRCPKIFVGDSAQQIFEWRGAVDALKAFPDAETLYLSQSFRFGQAIADVANAVLATLDEPTPLRLKGRESVQSQVVITKRENKNGIQERTYTGLLPETSGSTADAGQRGEGAAADDRGTSPLRPVRRGVRADSVRDRISKGGDSEQPVTTVLNAAAKVTGTRAGDDPADTGLSRVAPNATDSGHLCVLTRTNAAAVATLLNAMGQGKRPFLVGGGAEVIAFVEAALALQQGRGTSFPELACFSTWVEVEEYAANDPGGEDLKLMVKLVKEFGCRAIIDALRNMPPEADADLIISTAHKSKGREWDRVRLAGDFKVKSKCDDAELKLLYVAVTRAKLVLDVSGCPFFTGDDSLDISKVVKDERGQVSEVRRDGANSSDSCKEHRIPDVRPTPLVSVQTRTEAFTWTKFRDVWMVRGPKDRRSGEWVEVVRKNGAKSRERLGVVAWEGDEASIYRVT